MAITYIPAKEIKGLARFVDGVCQDCCDTLLDCICDGDPDKEVIICETCFEASAECLCSNVQEWENW